MMQHSSLGFAILGAGRSAEDYRLAIRLSADQGACLVAVGHYDPARYTEISEQFGVPCVSEDAILADSQVDVVCICTPNQYHAAQTIKAIQAGKHVLVEPPMALSVMDADAMIQASEAVGVKLGVMYQYRAKLLYRRIREAIIGGDLGDLTSGVLTMPFFRPAEFFTEATWRGAWRYTGGGVLMSQGIHLVDLLVWYMGDPISVQGYADTLHRDIEVEDTLGATLRFANGALATIMATTTAIDGYPHRIEIYGTNGGIRTEGDVLTDWRVMNLANASVPVPKRSEAIRSSTSFDPRVAQVEDHVTIIKDFMRAIHEDREPFVSGYEGRRSIATVATIYRAAGLLKT